MLADLPGAIEAKCPADAIFEPEYLGGEREESEAMRALLAALQGQSARLARYEDSVDAFGKDYGIWLTAEQTKGSGGPAPRRGQQQDSNESRAQAYDKLLQGMEAQCAAILKESAAVASAIDEASAVQERLYHSYQSVRWVPLSAARFLFILFSYIHRVGDFARSLVFTFTPRHPRCIAIVYTEWTARWGGEWPPTLAPRIY